MPWQVVPGPAAQSFWPLSATPKHFSLPASIAILTCSAVSGAAEASVAMAVANAPARAAELTIDFADISDISLLVTAPFECAIGSSDRRDGLLLRPDHTKS